MKLSDLKIGTRLIILIGMLAALPMGMVEGAGAVSQTVTAMKQIAAHSVTTAERSGRPLDEIVPGILKNQRTGASANFKRYKYLTKRRNQQVWAVDGKH